MVQMLGYLPQWKAPELPDVGNALNKLGESVRYYRSESDKAQAYADAQEQKRYSRGRSAAGDGKAEVEAFGKRALQVAQMPDDDPMKPKLWGYILDSHNKRNPGAQLSAEEMDWKTGPKLMAAQAGQFLDPYEQEERKLKLEKLRRDAAGPVSNPLDDEYKRAQIEKLRMESSGQGATADYGKTGTVFQGPDGKMYAARWAADGTQKIVEITTDAGQGLTPFRGVGEVDIGTGTRIYDKATGGDVRTIAKDLAGAERDKVIGREMGEGQLRLPKMARALDQYEATDDAVMKAISDARKIATESPTATGPMGGLSKNLWGTPGFNLKERLKPIRANLGFDRLQDMRDNSPTGGALGQVAVQELDMLQSTYASLEQAQSKEQFMEALNEIESIRRTFRRLKRKAYQDDVARFGSANVPNPETGQIGASQGVGASGGGAAADPLGIR